MKKVYPLFSTIVFVLLALSMHIFLNFLNQFPIFQKDVELKLMNLIVKKAEIFSSHPISVSLISKKTFVSRIDGIEYLSQYNHEEYNYSINISEEYIKEIEIVSNRAIVTGKLSSSSLMIVRIQASWLISFLLILFMASLFMSYIAPALGALYEIELEE